MNANEYYQWIKHAGTQSQHLSVSELLLSAHKLRRWWEARSASFCQPDEAERQRKDSSPGLIIIMPWSQEAQTLCFREFSSKKVSIWGWSALHQNFCWWPIKKENARLPSFTSFRLWSVMQKSRLSLCLTVWQSTHKLNELRPEKAAVGAELFGEDQMLSADP